jgi:ribonuclease-3
MEEERLAALKELEGRLWHRFNKIAWLDQALTHKSFIYEANSSRKLSNEVLEFLGDAVLNLVVSHLLLQKFPEAQEGALSVRRAHLVNRNTLALLSRELQVEGHLLLGKGEMLNGGMKKSSILANAYEALIGAIYMDSGFNRALEVIRLHLKSYLQSETPFPLFNDHKSLLQEQTQRVHGLSPQYRVLKEFGPGHDKRFQASVVIGGEVKGIGWGKSKKLAEQEAAKNALEGSKPEEIFPEGLNQEGCQ